MRGIEIECDLVRDAGRDGCKRTGEQRVDRAMIVAEQNALDLAVLADELREAPRPLVRPISSMWRMPVRNGAWCMKITTGFTLSAASARSRNASRFSHSAPPPLPGVSVSSPISRTGKSSTAHCTNSGSATMLGQSANTAFSVSRRS